MAPKYDANTSADVVVKDLASQIEGKVILTTGVSPGGLGSVFVEQVAQGKPKLLILAGRSAEKLKKTAEVINKTGVATKTLELDLSSLAKVREAAELVNSWDDVPNIDVLVNNAAVMAIPYGKTVDGYEMQLGTNHLGPFLFTNLILPKIMASKEPRVVMVSSEGHRLSPFRFGDHDFKGGENYHEWTAYGQSKTGNMLMAQSLAKKLGPKGLQAFSLHPGIIATNIDQHVDWSKQFASMQTVDKVFGNYDGWINDFKWKSPEQGVSTHVFAAFSPDIKAYNGSYLQDSGIPDRMDPEITVKCWGTDPFEAEKVWKFSEKLVGQKFL